MWASAGHTAPFKSTGKGTAECLKEVALEMNKQLHMLGED